MTQQRLSRKQRELVKELEELASMFTLDFQNALSYDPDGRTQYLLAAKNKMIRGQLIMWYTLIDELLTTEICHYFFGRKRGFIQLWRTQRFRHFNHYVLDEIPLLQKLRLVRAIKSIPRRMVADIERINALRNAIAHSFFPENRRSKPTYKGDDIFTIAGVTKMLDDCQAIYDYFLKF